MKCPKIPISVVKKLREGAVEVTHCEPQYNSNLKIIERKGRKICAVYRKEDIPINCFNQ